MVVLRHHKYNRGWAHVSQRTSESERVCTAAAATAAASAAATTAATTVATVTVEQQQRQLAAGAVAAATTTMMTAGVTAAAMAAAAGAAAATATSQTDHHHSILLNYHFLTHTTLDVFALRLPQKTADQDFGLLYAISEDLAAYGWLTNTGVKFVVFVSCVGVGGGIREGELKTVSF